jgi:hypothetical protein
MSQSPKDASGVGANHCGGSDAPSVSQKAAASLAEAVLRHGGEVHRVSDGKGGYFQISIINPGALRRGAHKQGGQN